VSGPMNINVQRAVTRSSRGCGWDRALVVAAGATCMAYLDVTGGGHRIGAGANMGCDVRP